MLESVPGPVQRLVDEIAARFRPERIILFGSHAAGTADDGSDVDFLVVMEAAESPLKKAVEIYRSLDHDVPVDISVRTPTQIGMSDPCDLLLRTVLAEGITLYEG